MLTHWTVDTGPKRPFGVSWAVFWQLGVVDECNYQMAKYKRFKRQGTIPAVQHDSFLELTIVSFSTRRGGGVLPYITYTGMCCPKGSWFWSSWFRTGYPLQRRFLERGIIFQTHESSTFVNSHLKVFKDRLLLKIRFNALTSKPLDSCSTLERSIKNWPISRTGYQF